MNSTFLEMLKSADETDRKYALEDICSTQDRKYVPFVLPLLMDPSTAVREAAGEVLISFKSPECVQWAVESLASANVKMRNQAVEILIGIGEPSVTVLINSGFIHSDPDVRKLSLDVICTMNSLRRKTHPELFEALEKMIGDSNLNVACSAIEALGKLQDSESIPLLLGLMCGSEWVQCCVVEALIMISSEASEAALNGLARSSNSGPAQIRIEQYMADMQRTGKAS